MAEDLSFSLQNIAMQQTGRQSETLSQWYINPVRPNSDLSQTSHCNISRVYQLVRS